MPPDSKLVMLNGKLKFGEFIYFICNCKKKKYVQKECKDCGKICFKVKEKIKKEIKAKANVKDKNNIYNNEFNHSRRNPRQLYSITFDSYLANSDDNFVDVNGQPQINRLMIHLEQFRSSSTLLANLLNLFDDQDDVNT
jgi:hypothetical protein